VSNNISITPFVPLNGSAGNEVVTTLVRPQIAVPIAAGVGVVDWSQGDNQTAALAASTTVSFIGAQAGQTLTLRVTAGGAYTIAFPAAMLFVGGSQATQTSGGVDIWEIKCLLVGSTLTYYGSVSQAFAT